MVSFSECILCLINVVYLYWNTIEVRNSDRTLEDLVWFILRRIRWIDFIFQTSFLYTITMLIFKKKKNNMTSSRVFVIIHEGQGNAFTKAASSATV